MHAIDRLEPRVLFAIDFIAEFPPEVAATVPQQVTPGGELEVTVRLRNRGGTGLAGIGYRTFLSTDRQIGNDDDISVSWGGMGTMRVLKGWSFDFDMSFYPGEFPAGQRYFFAVQLDPNNDIAENQEGNNLLVSDQPIFVPTGSGGHVQGTSGNDVITFSDLPGDEEFIQVTVNGEEFRKRRDSGAWADGGDGDDLLQVAQGLVLEQTGSFLGGGGRDTLIGSDGGDDNLQGQAGRDLLIGNAGDDRLNGGGGNDRMAGGAGNDNLLGEAGNDQMHGGPGTDFFNGGTGNDVLYARDTDVDTVWGGDAFDDLAQTDRTDIVSSLERRLPNEPVF